MTVRLGDCSSDRRYFEFDPDTGAWSHLLRMDRAGRSGIGQLLRSPGEGKVFVAKYLWRDDAWFTIGTEKWRLFDESLTLEHRETRGGFICEFTVHQGGACLRRLRYWRKDWLLMILDPTYDHLDFSLENVLVDFVPTAQPSLQQQRQDFIRIWTENAARRA